MDVQYVMNAKGEKTAVQLSMKDWDELLSNPEILKVIQDLRQAFREVAEMKAGRLKSPTLEEVLATL